MQGIEEPRDRGGHTHGPWIERNTSFSLLMIQQSLANEKIQFPSCKQLAEEGKTKNILEEFSWRKIFLPCVSLLSFESVGISYMNFLESCMAANLVFF